MCVSIASCFDVKRRLRKMENAKRLVIWMPINTMMVYNM